MKLSAAEQMAYEVFKRTVVRVEQPALSVFTDGRIGINAAAARVLAGAGVKFALLLWDKTNCKLGIKASPKDDENAYAVSIAHGRQSGTVRAKAFFKYIGWSAPRRKMLPATWNEKDKMLEITLPREFIGSDRAKDTKLKARTDV